MLSLYGHIYTSGHTADPAVLKQVVRSGNLEKQDKAKIVKAIVAAEKAEEKAKMPALDLRAMYGNSTHWRLCLRPPRRRLRLRLFESQFSYNFTTKEPSVKSDSTCETQPILVGMSPLHLIET